MKRRILSITLALCLCISSQSVVSAAQGDSSPKVDHANGNVENLESSGETEEESAKQPDSSGDMDNTLQKTPDQPEEDDKTGTGDNASQPEDGDEAGTGDNANQPKDNDETGTGETTEQPESSGVVNTIPQETPSEPESGDEIETGETPSEPESGDEIETGETSSEPESNNEVESPIQSEGADTEETTKELDTSGDLDAELLEISLLQDAASVGRAVYQPEIPSVTNPVPSQVYSAMIALKEKEGYTEGSTWTDYEPYSDSAGYYRWQGGPLGGKNIVGVGCVAFAFSLSDAAFGTLQARMYEPGAFQFEDIKVGDILRMNTDTHTVIVLKVSDAGVVIAEGNNNGKVHWGRGISKEDVMRDTSHYITRYPEGYDPTPDPDADTSIGSGVMGDLRWNLTKAGKLTISGNGAMPDYDSASEQPWDAQKDQIRQVVIEEGVTSIGACAFWDSRVLSVEIPSSVKAIGRYAFYNTPILSVTIPSSVKTIGSSAFQKCAGLRSVTFSDGVETIEQNAFRACTNLSSISLPASIGEVGAAAFFEWGEMITAKFASGSKPVMMGDDIFGRCYKLMGVTLPSNINCISKGMFQNCLMLSGVEIPQGVESIATLSFASCGSLTTIVIPDSVTTIEAGVFGGCPLKEIYFTGTEEQWNSIRKGTDTITAVSNATIHYNYTPATPPDPDDGSGEQPGTPPDEDKPGENNPGDNKPGENNPGDNKPGENKPGENNPGDNKPGDNKPGESEPGVSTPDDSRPDESSSVEDSQNMILSVDTWKPTTPDEIKRYGYMGKEPVRCVLPKENVYPVEVDNAMQGPMCVQVFEAVRGDYMIGRTYNIYAVSENTYTTDQKVRITIQIPQAIYKKDREYKMICVTEGGLPVVYDDLDSDPKTITIETDTFHAYALIYK